MLVSECAAWRAQRFRTCCRARRACGWERSGGRTPSVELASVFGSCVVCPLSQIDLDQWLLQVLDPVLCVL